MPSGKIPAETVREKIDQALTESKVSQKLMSVLQAPLHHRFFSLVREKFYLKAFGFFKVPLIFYVSPSIVELSDRRCVIRIPLNRRTKNHLGSMYFGTLAVGADVAGGLIAVRLIRKEKIDVSFVFKDFHAQFLKRPEGPVFFTCEEGEAIQTYVAKAIESGVRQNFPVHVTATVPSISGAEPVAQFTLTLSLKRQPGGQKV